MPPTTPQQPKPEGTPIPPASEVPITPPPGFGAGVAEVQHQQVEANLKTTEEKYKRIKLVTYVLMGALAIAVIVALVFGFLYGRAVSVNKVQYDKGETAGRDAQKKEDDEATVKASLSDTRTYTAPKELGGFTMEIPKNFSISTAGSGSTPLIVLANPDKVDTAAKNLALRVTVRNELYSKVKAGYDRDAKEGRNGLKAGEELKVDGRDAIRYVGKFDRRETAGTLVLVEYRDKTVIIQTDNNDDATLLDAYNKILNSVTLP